MGIQFNGINGHFYGKAGDLVGSSWNGRNYIKRSPAISTRPKSEKQLAQQAKFALTVRFLHPVKELVNIGFRQQYRPATGFNLAVKHTLEQAITGQYPDYAIDYPKVQYSKGTLGKPEGLKLMPGKGCLLITWHGDRFRTKAYGTDRVHLIIYEPETNTYLHGPADVYRMQEAAVMAIPEQFSGKKLHVYLFASRPGLVSDTVYAGEISI